MLVEGCSNVSMPLAEQAGGALAQGALVDLAAAEERQLRLSDEEDVSRDFIARQLRAAELHPRGIRHVLGAPHDEDLP